jgi:60 kDa SS-A/Ro ribonucleoprotein
MASKTYSKTAQTRVRANAVTPQTQAIRGREKDMVKNSAGGVVFSVSDFSRLDRFLILGSEGGSYYASERKLTKDNAAAVMRAIAADGVRVVNRVVEISVAGRAPKNDPALFTLAMVMTHGSDEAKAAAYQALTQVARTGTHVLHLADYVNGMRTWGRGIRRAFAAWYNEKTPMQLAHQLVKYANRDGWTHKDVLRLAHVKPATDTHNALFADVTGKGAKELDIDVDVANFIAAVDEIKTMTEKDVKAAVKLIEAHKLPREVIPTELLNTKAVWESLLPHMGTTALVRNLATMTRIGLIGPMSSGAKDVIAKLGDVERVKKDRIHPIQVLTALLTYRAGRGQRGNNTWTPTTSIIDALDELFYVAFQNVIPTGKRIGLFLDVSGSMTGGEVGGVIGLSPRMASAAMAMMTMRTEKDYVIAGFTSGTYPGGWGRSTKKSGFTSARSGDGITELPFSHRQRLDDVVNLTEGLDFGGTDCSLPFLWALKNKVELDAFVVYTDNETYAGRMQPVQALNKYRKEMGIPAKSVVVGLTATGFSIADPNDFGMMDVVGFDSAAPAIMSDFIRGDF